MFLHVYDDKKEKKILMIDRSRYFSFTSTQKQIYI